MANKGYPSASSMYRVARRLYYRHMVGKELAILHMGDHDPSGIDMTRDIEERLYMLSNGKPITINRIALNFDQIEDLNPPENPAKMSDSRAPGYVAEFGHSSWELDAIEPKALASLTEEAIKEYRDEGLWKNSIRKTK